MFVSVFSSSTSSFQARFSNFANQGEQFQSGGKLAVALNQHSRQQASLPIGSIGSGGAIKVDAFSVFERAMAMGYEKLQEKLQLPVSDLAPGSKVHASMDQEGNTGEMTAERVAGNILGFIERRLMLDVADGATPEQLESRLEAGLKGFKQGFEEAREQIEALGFLNPDIEEGIGRTYDLVLEGVEGLREKYLDQSEPETSELAANDELPPSPSAVALGTANYDFAQRNTFSFELETADGDTVTISARATEVYSSAYAVGSIEGEQGSLLAERFSSSYQSRSSFALDVDGELDAEELHAINDLLGQVNDLASDFFAGDLDQAFEQALNLGYDSEEITSFSLNLTHVEVQRVAAAYQRVGEEPGNGRGGAGLGNLLTPVGHFARDLLEAADTASRFAEPLALMMELADKMADAHRYESEKDEKHHGQNDRLHKFMDRMLKDLDV